MTDLDTFLTGLRKAAYVGGCVNAKYLATAAHGRLDRADFVTPVRNSFLGSFLSDQAVAAQLAAIDGCVGSSVHG